MRCRRPYRLPRAARRGRLRPLPSAAFTENRLEIYRRRNPDSAPLCRIPRLVFRRPVHPGDHVQQSAVSGSGKGGRRTGELLPADRAETAFRLLPRPSGRLAGTPGGAPRFSLPATPRPCGGMVCGGRLSRRRLDQRRIQRLAWRAHHHRPLPDSAGAVSGVSRRGVAAEKLDFPTSAAEPHGAFPLQHARHRLGDPHGGRRVPQSALRHDMGALLSGGDAALPPQRNPDLLSPPRGVEGAALHGLLLSRHAAFRPETAGLDSVARRPAVRRSVAVASPSSRTANTAAAAVFETGTTDPAGCRSIAALSPLPRRCAVVPCGSTDSSGGARSRQSQSILLRSTPRSRSMERPLPPASAALHRESGTSGSAAEPAVCGGDSLFPPENRDGGWIRLEISGGTALRLPRGAPSLPDAGRSRIPAAAPSVHRRPGASGAVAQFRPSQSVVVPRRRSADSASRPAHLSIGRVGRRITGRIPAAQRIRVRRRVAAGISQHPCPSCRSARPCRSRRVRAGRSHHSSPPAEFQPPCRNPSADGALACRDSSCRVTPVLHRHASGVSRTAAGLVRHRIGRTGRKTALPVDRRRSAGDDPDSHSADPRECRHPQRQVRPHVELSAEGGASHPPTARSGGPAGVARHHRPFPGTPAISASARG